MPAARRHAMMTPERPPTRGETAGPRRTEAASRTATSPGTAPAPAPETAGIGARATATATTATAIRRSGGGALLRGLPEFAVAWVQSTFASRGGAPRPT